MTNLNKNTVFDQLIGQTLANKYRIEERLREDSFSRTYRATHVIIDKPVLLKILNPTLAVDGEIAAQFQQEAKTLSRTAHPNILNALDYGTDERGYVYMVLEDFRGETLANTIRTEKRLSLYRAADIIRQICAALAVAHGQNIFHGNLSSDKILVAEKSDGSEEVKILDFGSASSIAEADDGDEEKTVVRSDMPYYKSPEQLTEESAPDSRSDIYALGVLLYEMLSGNMPFAGDKPQTVMMKHIQEIPPSLLAVNNDLPPTIEQIVQRALAKQPDARFQTVAEFSGALTRAAKTGEDETVVRPRPIEIASAAARPVPAVEPANENNRWRTAFIVLLGIALLGGGLIYMTMGKRTDPNTQATTDANAQPAQPIYPTTGGVENLDATNPAIINSNINPSAFPQGAPGSGGSFPPPGVYTGNSRIVEVYPTNPSTMPLDPSFNPTQSNGTTNSASNTPRSNSGVTSGNTATPTPTIRPSSSGTPVPAPVTPRPQPQPQQNQQQPRSNQNNQ